jgi:hypothetical protein
MTKFIDVGRTGRSGNGGPPQAKEYADLSVIEAGKYLVYYPSKSAEEVIKTWEYGVRLRWELDDSDRPIAIHLSPASETGRYFRLRNSGEQRPRISFPTSHVGQAKRHRDGPQRAEESSITTNEVVIAIPAGCFPA